MTTRQLYYLVTIADQGSLSGAAQVLGISQPALSKFLNDYEDSLGFLLFLRYHRQLTPTAVGRYVIECSQRILDEQTRLLQTLRAVTDSNHTRIRLATAPNRGAIIYSRIYNQFSNRYPDISLSLTELYASDQPGAILHGQVDLAIGSGKTSDKVTDLPIAYEELLVSLPVSHPMSWAERIRLSDLKDTPFVLQGPRHSIRILADELFKEAGFSPVVAFESNDVLLVDSMLHQAVGAGLVSQAHVFPCEELVYRPLEPPIQQTLHIRYPLDHTLTEPEQYLAGLLIRERLSDPRYRPILTPEVEALMKIVDQDQENVSGSHGPDNPPSGVRASRYSPPEINLNTQLLQYIIAIVDEKSLTQAAEKYYLTQPALSRYLRNIEDMLCTKLFTRVHNRLRPNNAGKIFVNFARNILQIEAEMSDHIQSYRKGHGGGIHLQCDPTLADAIRSQAEPEFARLHPDVNLQIAESDRDSIQEALLNASADCGLYFSCEEKHPILDSRILKESRLIYCSADAALNFPPDFPRKLMLASAGSSLRMEQDRILEGLFPKPQKIVCEASPDILNTLTRTGSADTILPQDLLPKEALPRCHALPGPQNYYLLLVSHPGRNLPPPMKDLVRILNDLFGV